MPDQILEPNKTFQEIIQTEINMLDKEEELLEFLIKLDYLKQILEKKISVANNKLLRKQIR